MGDNKTGSSLPLSTIECIRIWAVWKSTLETMSRMEKMVPRGLITSGLLDSLTGVCIGFHVGAWRVISKSGLGSGQGSGSSHTRLQNRPWCSNRLSQAMPYRITLTVRTGLAPGVAGPGSRRLGWRAQAAYREPGSLGTGCHL